MDNLTHSLAGALLGQMGLKRKTGLAMPTLIIAANLPDIDAVATLAGGMQHLALRRGVTHGPIALVLLPIILWAIMVAFDRWQGRRGTRPAGRLPVHRGWLLALAYVGCLSHPALDWLNTYGIRLLEPFSSRWVYGNTLFIIDLWVWAALIWGVWLSRRREKRGGDWRRPAWVGFAAIGAYIFANGLFTGVAERKSHDWVAAASGTPPTLVVASPPPVAFWRRDIMWRNAAVHGERSFGLRDIVTMPAPDANALSAKPNGMDDPRIPAMVARSADARAFLFWARMPVARFEADGTLVLSDQRYDAGATRGRFVVWVKPE